MAEPVTPALVAAAPQALAAGLLATVLARLHIDPWLLFTAFFGAILGLASAPKGRAIWHDAAVFLAVVFGSSWIGASLAPWIQATFPAVRDPEGPATFMLAAVFHPGFNWFVSAVPAILSFRFGVSKGEAK